MASERLQKLIAKAGYGSRRACETFITQGRVTVNGKVATLGTQADLSIDEVRVDGTRIKVEQSNVYVMLNKPRGIISDEDVAGKWPRARDMIPLDGHLYPVGRLDIDSDGLMLFTNDGDLAHKLTHPRYEHPKTYRVLVEGEPTQKTLGIWRRGIPLDGVQTAPAEIRLISKTRDGTMLEVVVHEGRKRQLRRVAASLGHPVIALHRTKLGPLVLGGLAEGSWRHLSKEEVESLNQVRISEAPRRRFPASKSHRPVATMAAKPTKKNDRPRRRQGSR